MLAFFSLPHRVLFAFAVLLLGVALYTIQDSTRRSELESIEIVSALGDENFFPSPERFGWNDLVVHFEGRPLYRVQTSFSSKEDWVVHPAGRDDSGTWIVYREVPRKGNAAPPDPDRLYLKAADRQFLVLSPVPQP